MNKIWDDDPPPKARSGIHTNMSRIKARLQDIGEDAYLHHRSGAYVLETDPENVDYHRFRQLRAQARTIEGTGDGEQAAQLLREAVGLWRGEPLGGLSGSWVARTRQNLDDEFLAASVERSKLELRLGHHADITAELAELIARYPYDEKLVELQMLALHRSGRVTSALEVYRAAHRRLTTDHGTETGHRLRELHQRILRGDPSLRPAPRRRPDAPNNLPRDVFTFTGRTDEIRQLTAMAAARANAVTVLAVDGMPGVGKTALALHLAHRLTPEYPDGQLYLNLYGHHAEQSSVDAATALGRLLRVLGVPAAQIPQGLEERATLWRTELARRRMLIVLDDATGHDQIGHLLPGTPGCLVLITSRRRLAGLDDVLSVTLDALPPDDATTLFDRVIGPRRHREALHIASVVRLCGYLPLAIQLVGSRLRVRPALRVADLLARLGDQRRRLSEIHAGNREITAAFELSFHELDEVHQRAFRLLGLHPGTDFTIESACALLQGDKATVEGVLDGLLDHHLIAEPQHGRYRFHDLIGEYARLLAGREPLAQRRQTLIRILDLYLFAADQADRLLHPQRERAAVVVTYLPPVRPGMASAEQARDWLETELDNLRQLVRHAAEERWTRHAALLPHVLSTFLEDAGHWDMAAELHECAVTAWHELEDQAGLATALSDLAKVRWRGGNLEHALRHATEGLAIRRGLGDQAGVAELLDQIGLVHWHRSDFEAAFDYCGQALDIRRSLGDLRGEAASLNSISILAYHQGDFSQAAERMQQALRVYQRLGDARGQLVTLNNWQEFELRLGRYASARALLEQAATISPDMSRQHQAIWLCNMANVLQHIGDYSAALDSYRRSSQIYGQVGDRRGISDVLNQTGFCYGLMDRDDQALAHHQRALSLAREISERYEQCLALRGMGEVYERAGRLETALDYYRQALEIARGIGDVYQESLNLDRMGSALVRSDPSQAERYWRQAIGEFERMGVPEGPAARLRLAQVERYD
ncbi:BTAD domain-containing putative transcriptional regulator [Acrocarpospora macrocephala]|uniref:SARP family transcriptional regulator n=2 Tax=Acrocarpospora macrocephala TaxID=150177 RepID=A0A5M3X6M4_9ACTN|nr:SARP family transcriptional regulator [Acrocarpospora macrocephala]